MDDQAARIRRGILAWYDFGENPRVLFAGGKDDGCTGMFQEKLGTDIIEAGITPPKGKKYDFVILTEAFERHEDPVELFRGMNGALKDGGKLLLLANNRFGLRYFCGDMDPYTLRCFDGIDGYEKAELRNAGGYAGRMYSRSEIGRMLGEAGFKDNKFFAVLPDLDNAAFVYADGYAPNEDMNDRLYPAYNNPGTVFLEEETLYNSIIENNMLHAMANAFFVECSLDGRHTDVLQATCTAGREDRFAMATVIYGSGHVEKKALYPEGAGQIERLSANMEKLRDRGICTVPFSRMRNGMRMPYVDAETGQLHLKRLLHRDKGLFLKHFDRLCGLIRASSEIYNGDDGREYFRKAYLDMVPLNSLWSSGDFMFFDQEFTADDYPVKAVLARAVATFYGGNVALEKILPARELYARYGLWDDLDEWLGMERDFLEGIRNEKALAGHHRRTRRDGRLTEGNRRKMNYSCAGWKAHEANPLIDINGRRLVLFGSGKYAERFIDLYGMDYEIDFIVDNDRKRQDERLHGIKIYGAERIQDVSEDEYKVIVCVKDYMSIFRQLDGYGLRNYGLYDGKYSQHKIFVDKESQSLPKRYHIGYCAGAFDMFHIGHLNLLRRAKERCDYLIVGVMSDERMYDLKKKYPIIPCNERMQVVAGCRYVDQVEELPADRAGIMDAYNMFHFDCMFSGDDHAEDVGWLAERERLRQHGSDIVFVSYTKETSSSEIRQKMKDDAGKVLPRDSRLLTDRNHRWIYTYDYASDSVWDEWKSSCGITEEVSEWIEHEADTVAYRIQEAGHRDLTTYLLLADSHFAYNGTWEDTVASMRAVAERIRLEGIIHLGDLTDGLLPLARTEEIEDKVLSDMRSLGVSVHVMPGNHDYNYFRNNPEIRYPDKPRFFVDDDRNKLRLIFIDSFDPKEKVRYGFSEECVSWLDGALSSIHEGYRSIVFSHVPPLVRLQAWTKDIRNRGRLIEVLDRNADKIMALISGHSHCDLLFNDLHNGKLPIVLINCAKCEYFLEHKPKDAIVPFRRLGDRTQESFDIMQVDTVKNEIYFTRFGAGRDRVVRNHKAEWM